MDTDKKWRAVEMLKLLTDEYSIHNMKELNRAIEQQEKIDISIFVSRLPTDSNCQGKSHKE